MTDDDDNDDDYANESSESESTIASEFLINVRRCAIRYHLYNLKNMKTTMEECYFK